MCVCLKTADNDLTITLACANIILYIYIYINDYNTIRRGDNAEKQN